MALWWLGPRRQIQAPCDWYIADIRGMRLSYQAGPVRNAVAANDSIEIVIQGAEQPLWRGSAAEFMALVVDSIAHERQGER